MAAHPNKRSREAPKNNASDEAALEEKIEKCDKILGGLFDFIAMGEDSEPRTKPRPWKLTIRVRDSWTAGQLPDDMLRDFRAPLDIPTLLESMNRESWKVLPLVASVRSETNADSRGEVTRFRDCATFLTFVAPPLDGDAHYLTEFGIELTVQLRDLRSPFGTLSRDLSDRVRTLDEAYRAPVGPMNSKSIAAAIRIKELITQQRDFLEEIERMYHLQ